jgi:hypothetical protein
MSVNAEVQRSGNETALAVIRKFSRRVQGTGLVKTVRNRRYFSRDASKIVRKKRALKLIKRRKEYQQLVKEGKVVETPSRMQRTGGPSREQAPARLGEDTPIAR